MTTLSVYRRRREGIGHGPTGAGTEGLGQTPMDEREIVLSVLNGYVSSATSLSRQAQDASAALSEFLSKREKLTNDSGKIISNKANVTAAKYAAQGQILMAPIAAALAAMEGMKFFSSFVQKSRISETAREIYDQVSDVLKRTQASWEIFKNLRVADLEQSILPAESVNELATYLGISQDSIRGMYLLLVMRLMAAKIGIASEWDSKATPAGTQITKALADLESKLKSVAFMVKTEASKVPGTQEWNNDLQWIKGESLREYLGLLKAEYDKELAGRTEPGILERAFNITVGFFRTYGKLLLYSMLGPVGVFAYFVSFRSSQLEVLSKAGYAAARLIPASVKGLEEWATTFSEEFKRARLDEGQPESTAYEEASRLAVQKTEQAVGPELHAAQNDIERYQNDYKAMTEAFDAFVGSAKAFLEKLLLYGGIALGGIVVIYAAVPAIIKKL